MIHEIQIDEMSPMNSQELRWVESSLELGKREIYQVAPSANAYGDVVVLGFQSLDLADRYRGDLAAIAHEDSR